jgi:hypothetical protein
VTGEARERLGLKLGGVCRVNVAAVKQPGEVAQRSEKSPLGVLDRDRRGGDLRLVVRRCGCGVRENRGSPPRAVMG